MSSYRQTMDYLFGQLPMFQREGVSALKKDLTNIQAICQHLNHPQDNYPTIHIAGTNGKGSVAHILGAILQAHGLRTGIYTSPHYRDFRERIKVNGKIIHRKNVVEFVDAHKEYFDKLSPSFFEITVAMAFDFFSARKVDIAIIETGLGGRLDSTNIINPIISVITNISFDHQNVLGNTITEIAGEKAGIIKPYTPVVIGEKQTDANKVFQRVAKQEEAEISFASDNYEVKILRSSSKNSVFEVHKNNELKFSELKVNLTGNYQEKNLATAFEAIDVLGKTIVTNNIEERDSQQYEKAVKRLSYIARPKDIVIEQGLANLKSLTNFIGRWQIIADKPTVLVDSGHNEGALALTLKELQKMSYKTLHIIIGVVKDKDLTKMLKLFPKEAKYYFTTPNVPRGLPPKELRAAAESVGLEGRHYKSVKSSLKAALWHAKKDDLVFVGGSSFVVGEVL